MPTPDPHGPMRVIDGVPHLWAADPDGVRGHGHWESMVPPPTPEQEHGNTELMKQVLTLTGGIMGGAGAAALLPEAATAVGASRFIPAATRILGSAFGGAGGRMLGHTPEALVERTTGQRSGTDYGREATIGATEGALNEAAPMALEPVTSTAGTFLKWLGRAGLDNPALPMAVRARMAWLRGSAMAPVAWMAGGPGGAAIDAAASLGPVVASEAGQKLENLAPRLGTGTLSERVESGLGALKDRLFGRPLTHAERLAAGAEETLARKTAPWRVPEVYPKGPPSGGDPHFNPFAAVFEPPGPLPVAGSEIPREPLTIDRLAGERPLTDYSWTEWTRGGPAPGPPTGPRINPKATTGNPPDWPPSGLPPDVLPDVTVNPRGSGGENPPPREAVTYNPAGAVMSTTEQPWWLDKYALEPGDYPGAPPRRPDTAAHAAAAQAQNFVSEVAGYPANLTPEELAKYYETRYPPKGPAGPAGPAGGGPGGVVPKAGVKAPPPVLDPEAQALRDQTGGSMGALQKRAMSPQQLDAAFTKMQAQNAAARAASSAENLVSDVAGSTTGGAEDPAAAFARQYNLPSAADATDTIAARKAKYAAERAAKAAAGTTPMSDDAAEAYRKGQTSAAMDALQSPDPQKNMFALDWLLKQVKP